MELMLYVQSNGGDVTDRENEADLKVADHLKAKAAPLGR
jgi:hypothetical protein